MEIESLKLNVQRRVRLFPPHKIQNICDSKCAKMLREWVDMKVREKERPWSKYPWFKASSDYKYGNTLRHVTCGVRLLYGELLSRSAKILVKESISASRLERLSSRVFSGPLIYNKCTAHVKQKNKHVGKFTNLTCE